MKITIQLQIGLVYIPLLYVKRLNSGDVHFFVINYGIQTVFIFLRDSSVVLSYPSLGPPIGIIDA